MADCNGKPACKWEDKQTDVAPKKNKKFKVK